MGRGRAFRLRSSLGEFSANYVNVVGRVFALERLYGGKYVPHIGTHPSPFLYLKTLVSAAAATPLPLPPAALMARSSEGGRTTAGSSTGTEGEGTLRSSTRGSLPYEEKSHRIQGKEGLDASPLDLGDVAFTSRSEGERSGHLSSPHYRNSTAADNGGASTRTTTPITGGGAGYACTPSQQMYLLGLLEVFFPFRTKDAQENKMGLEALCCALRVQRPPFYSALTTATTTGRAERSDTSTVEGGGEREASASPISEDDNKGSHPNALLNAGSRSAVPNDSTPVTAACVARADEIESAAAAARSSTTPSEKEHRVVEPLSSTQRQHVEKGCTSSVHQEQRVDGEETMRRNASLPTNNGVDVCDHLANTPAPFAFPFTLSTSSMEEKDAEKPRRAGGLNHHRRNHHRKNHALEFSLATPASLLNVEGQESAVKRRILAQQKAKAASRDDSVLPPTGKVEPTNCTDVNDIDMTRQGEDPYPGSSTGHREGVPLKEEHHQPYETSASTNADVHQALRMKPPLPSSQQQKKLSSHDGQREVGVANGHSPSLSVEQLVRGYFAVLRRHSTPWLPRGTGVASSSCTPSPHTVPPASPAGGVTRNPSLDAPLMTSGSPAAAAVSHREPTGFRRDSDLYPNASPSEKSSSASTTPQNAAEVAPAHEHSDDPETLAVVQRIVSMPPAASTEAADGKTTTIEAEPVRGGEDVRSDVRCPRTSSPSPTTSRLAREAKEIAIEEAEERAEELRLTASQSQAGHWNRMPMQSHSRGASSHGSAAPTPPPGATSSSIDAVSAGMFHGAKGRTLVFDAIAACIASEGSLELEALLGHQRSERHTHMMQQLAQRWDRATHSVKSDASSAAANPSPPPPPQHHMAHEEESKAKYFAVQAAAAENLPSGGPSPPTMQTSLWWNAHHCAFSPSPSAPLFFTPVQQERVSAIARRVAISSALMNHIRDLLLEQKHQTKIKRTLLLLTTMDSWSPATLGRRLSTAASFTESCEGAAPKGTHASAHLTCGAAALPQDGKEPFPCDVAENQLRERRRAMLRVLRHARRRSGTPAQKRAQPVS